LDINEILVGIIQFSVYFLVTSSSGITILAKELRTCWMLC
jgi:hypothetical protein